MVLSLDTRSFTLYSQSLLSPPIPRRKTPPDNIFPSFRSPLFACRRNKSRRDFACGNLRDLMDDEFRTHVLMKVKIFIAGKI